MLHLRVGFSEGDGLNFRSSGHVRSFSKHILGALDGGRRNGRQKCADVCRLSSDFYGNVKHTRKCTLWRVPYICGTFGLKQYDVKKTLVSFMGTCLEELTKAILRRTV